MSVLVCGSFDEDLPVAVGDHDGAVDGDVSASSVDGKLVNGSALAFGSGADSDGPEVDDGASLLVGLVSMVMGVLYRRCPFRLLIPRSASPLGIVSCGAGAKHTQNFGTVARSSLGSLLRSLMIFRSG